MSLPSAHKVLFVAGLHRSGTSILARCLGEHPQISGFSGTGFPQDEGQFLQTVYPVARRFGGPGEFAFHREMHVTEESELAKAEWGVRLLDEWLPYWDQRCPVHLEKSPPNILKLRLLQVYFPEAFLIVLVRHPVAVFLATRKWNRSESGHLFRHWAVAHGILWGDLPFLKNCLLLRYEDFVAYPGAVLGHLHKWLGLSTQDCPLKVEGEVNQRYYERWCFENSTPSLQAAVAEGRGMAARMGYDLFMPSEPSVCWSRTLPEETLPGGGVWWWRP